MGTIVLVLIPIGVVVFWIAKYIKSKSTPVVKATVVRKTVVKKEYQREDTKDKAIKKYNESKQK